jgi:Bacterial Ig-like domain (group 3)
MPAGPTGTVTYNDVLTYNGVASPSAVIGTAAVNGSNAIYSTFALAGGTHSITAAYSGDANYNGKSSSLVIVTVTPVGIASLNPTSVNFSSQPIGVPSMGIPVLLTNIGDANLSIAGVQVSGDNATDFQTSGNTCAGASLIPGASCVVNVKFNPNATGTRTASLIFTDNSNGIAGSTQPISLVGSSMSNSSANFTAKPIAGGTTLWFASELTWAKGPHDLMNVFMDMTNHPVRIFVTNGSIKFTANGTSYSIPVPDALITFSPLVTSVTTTFDAVNNRWLTTVPTVHPFSKLKQFDIEIGRIFASGAAFTVPAGGLPGGIKNVTWSAAYTTDTPGMDLRWRWGAAVYSQFSADYNALTVKPTDPTRGPWAKMTNNDQAGTPEAYKQYFLVNGGGTADDADDFTGDQTPNVGVVPDVAQATIAPIPVVFPGTQAAGTTTAPVIATITNNHQTLSLIVSSLTVSGIDFTLVSAGTMPCSLTGPTTLAGGASCTVGVVFSPKDMGTRTGSVNIGFSTPPGIAADEAPKPFKLDIVGVAK